MYAFTQLALKATSAILKSRVITIDAPGTCDEATANSVEPIGISAEYSEYAPGTAADSGQCADTGQSVPYYGRGRKCLAYVTTAVTGGTRVQAAAAGGIAPKSGTTTWSVGIAEDSAPAASYVYVLVDPIIY